VDTRREGSYFSAMRDEDGRQESQRAFSRHEVLEFLDGHLAALARLRTALALDLNRKPGDSSDRLLAAAKVSSEELWRVGESVISRIENSRLPHYVSKQAKVMNLAVFYVFFRDRFQAFDRQNRAKASASLPTKDLLRLSKSRDEKLSNEQMAKLKEIDALARSVLRDHLAPAEAAEEAVAIWFRGSKLPDLAAATASSVAHAYDEIGRYVEDELLDPESCETRGSHSE
jgi:hypothetical protein